MDIQQNTPYLTTPASYVARDHLTLQVEVPVYPPDLPPAERTRDRATDWRKLSIPVHMLESICGFGPSTIGPPALDLCREHGVAVNSLSEMGYLQAQKEWVLLRDRLLREIKVDEDSLRFYFLDEKAVQRIEHHGTDNPIDLSEPLIL